MSYGESSCILLFLFIRCVQRFNMAVCVCSPSVTRSRQTSVCLCVGVSIYC